jgi:hypothetical protein
MRERERECVREWQGESLTREGNEEKKKTSFQHIFFILFLFFSIFKIFSSRAKSLQIQTSEKKKLPPRALFLMMMVVAGREETVDTFDGDNSDNDYDQLRREQFVENVFPSRKIARQMREKLFLALRFVWSKFELYGWYFLLALAVYVTFKRQIRGFFRKLSSVLVGRRKKEKSFSAEEREKLERARRKQEEAWEKASRERLTKKTNVDKRIEAVEKKASRLGVAKQRKGHVLGRE